MPETKKPDAPATKPKLRVSKRVGFVEESGRIVEGIVVKLHGKTDDCAVNVECVPPGGQTYLVESATFNADKKTPKTWHFEG